MDEITWLDTAILVRVDTTETGWALQEAALLGLPWRVVAIDQAGLRGVLEGGADELAAATRDLDELTTVEVRDDAAVAVAADPAPVLAALGELGARPLGLYAHKNTVAVAIEGWRREAVAAALTRMSGSKIP